MIYKKTIINQVYWYNFANYLGFNLAFLASFILYPNNLKLLGEIRYIETIGHFIFPLILFGLPQALVKFSPLMQSYHLPRYYGTSIFIIALIATVVYFIIYTSNILFTINNYSYYLYGFVLAVCYAIIDLNKSISIIFEKVKFPIILEKILPKIALPLIFILMVNNNIDKTKSIDYYVILHVFLVVILFIYTFRFIIPVFSAKYYFLFERFTVKEFINFSFYSFLSSIGFLLAFRVDSYMIPQYLTMADNGAYNIALTISSLIGVPMAGFFLINSHFISQLIKDENYKELGAKYKESGVFLYWIGSLFFCLILIILPYLGYFMKDYTQVFEIKIITVLLSMSVLVNMGTSYNSEIINFSKHYKFNLYALLFLVLSNVILNLYFLTQTNYKLIGVAIASLISMFLFNFFKLMFIYKTLKILPFNKKYLKVFLISISMYGLIFVLPNLSSFVFTLLYKSIIVAVLYVCLIYKLNLIEYVTIRVEKYLIKK